MSENMQNLSQKIANALEFNGDIEIPSYITQNLNKNLREYQIKALKHFYLQRKNLQTNHLMFNMATGSGKTLIMAALMLECFKQGYRNFIFFVNSTAILEKTKANFCDEKSSKYLFKSEINIDGQRVSVNPVMSLSECKDEMINVYFSTVQGLYSLFTNERENAFTLPFWIGKFIFFRLGLCDFAYQNEKSFISNAKFDIFFIYFLIKNLPRIFTPRTNTAKTSAPAHATAFKLSSGS
ncbi:DEAD/DEAH box helicase family protein [Campylobacter iguaniorum]|uniref:DEAD/DEAH box helicase family protein n=1 Tax=Campylobacter iguaniorum TaxID=1244531 RepID=UPI0007C8F782